jgi:hypothetical protein
MGSAAGTSPARATRPENRELLVFWIIRDSACAECGEELGKGRFLTMEAGRPLCLACADLDHLVFLPRGNTALTRRARKHSTLSAVVLRFSRSRKRYERQGLLVEEQALGIAEQECLTDAEARSLARDRAAERRERTDEQYVRTFAEQVEKVFPGCPEREREAIAKHACLKYSGRIGRSSAARRFDETAIELAVQAHVRHAHTDYDELLARSMDRGEARAAVRATVAGVLHGWRR